MAEESVCLKTSGMHCNSCSMLVQLTVEDVPGVVSVTADYPAGETNVTFDPDVVGVDRIIEAIAEAGYEAEKPV